MTQRFPDVPTDPMFDAEEYRVVPDRPAAVKSVAQGNCPKCLRGKTGVLPTGAHWVWRTHYYTTWGGDTRLCHASGVALCVAPELTGKELNPSKPLACPHGTEPMTLEDAA